MTLTLIARNPYTHQVGVAIASGSDDCVDGSIASADGVGILSLQAKGNRDLRAVAFSMLREGVASQDILDFLKRSDSALDLRQLLIVPFEGDILGFTGAMCIEHAWHVVKPHHALAGNMLSSLDTLAAMERAYLADMHAPLRHRLFSALEAGIKTGGDVRGHKSAGIIIHGHQPLNIRITASAQPMEDLSAAVFR